MNQKNFSPVKSESLEVELFNTDKSKGIDSVRTNNPEEALQKLKSRYENGHYEINLV